MTLDIRTLLICNFTVTLVVGGMMWLYASRRTTGSGFRTYVWGILASAAGYLVFGIRGPVPIVASVVLTNLLFALAAILRLDGIFRFERDRRLPAALYAAPWLFAAVQTFFLVFRDAPPIRILISSVFLCASVGATAAILLRPPKGVDRRVRSLMGWFHVALGGLLLARGAYWVIVAPDDPLGSDPVFVAHLVFVVAFEAAQSVGLVLLNGERLEKELRASEALGRENAARLEEARADVNVLRGLLPICASCKSIRDDAGRWSALEQYMQEHSETRFSHGICPDCMRKLYPEYADEVALVSPGIADGG